MPGARQARGRAPVKAKRAGRPVDERSLRCRVAALKIVGIDDPAFMRRVMEHVVALQAEQAKLTAGSP